MAYPDGTRFVTVLGLLQVGQSEARRKGTKVIVIYFLLANKKTRVTEPYK